MLVRTVKSTKLAKESHHVAHTAASLACVAVDTWMTNVACNFVGEKFNEATKN